MMKEIDLEESKLIQMDILKSIDFFCRNNDIHYSLAAGSAIGAIRHKGFIPWDDDIDIIMMREDYNRFLSSYKGGRYNLLHYTTNASWDCYFACVEHPKTVAFWGKSKRSTRGVWVSIFPVDYVPEDDRELELLVDKVQNYTYKNPLLRLKKSISNTTFVRDALKAFGRYILKIVPYRYFYSKIDKNITPLLTKPTNRLSSVAGWTFNTFFDYSADCLSEYIDVDFEDMKCMLCKGYDEYLRKQYGNYMVLPPIEEQVPKHEATFYWKD